MKLSTKLKVLAVAMTSIATMTCAATSVEPWVATHTKATNVGTSLHVAPMQSGENIHIAIALQLRNEKELDAYVNQIKTNGNVAPMNSMQLMANHLPTEADANEVVKYLAAHGFRNIVIAKNRMLVSADGTAGTAKAAFNVDLHHFNVDGRMAHANVNDAVIPQSLANVVKSIHGLQTVHVAHSTLKVGKTSFADSTASYIMPKDYQYIYDAASLPPATNTAVGIITVGDLTQTLLDLHSFVATNGFAAPNVTVVHAGAVGYDTSGTDEWDLDTQAILGAAGGTVKALRLYNATGWDNASLTETYNAAVAENAVKVINVSLGECELGPQQDGSMVAEDAIFKLAIAQGQTFSISAGDAGAYTCHGSAPYQSYPAASPYVMAIGGTRVYGTGPIAMSGPLQYHTEVNTYAHEIVWSCANSYACVAGGGTGGGISQTEIAPAWQVAAGVLDASSATKRGVPDIAFDADPASGMVTIVGGGYTGIGGTSLASPLFVGFWARIQSAKGNNLPFPAQHIYANATTNPGWFHDVTFGGNGAYHAKARWDYTTGWGSLDIANFAASYP